MTFSNPGRPPFDIALRGYDRDEVEDLVTRLEESVAAQRAGRTALGTMTIAEAEAAHHNLSVTLRGYESGGVDAYVTSMIAELAHIGEAPVPAEAQGQPEHPAFPLVFRGYSPDEVEDLMTRLDTSMATLRSANRAPLTITATEAESARCNLAVQLRGLDRRQVDCYLTTMITELARLEGKVGR